MLVKQFQIRAFRGIESLDLRFQPGVNILIGVNGVGKSSILECLAPSILQYTELILPKRKVPLPLADSIKFGHDSSYFRIDFQASENRQGFWEWRLEKELDFFSNSTDSIDLNNTFLIGLWQDFKEQHTINQNHNIPLCIYFPSQRNIPQEESLRHSLIRSEKGALTLNYQALREKQIDFSDFFTWFKQREDLENEQRLENDPDYRDRELQAVRKAIPNFLPGFSNLRVRRTSLSITVAKNGQELAINQLSDGEKSLLTMVADIARQLAIHHPSLDDPLQGTGVVLIDEIDAHLHPQWQRRIVKTLQTTFPNCQFILATHSPFIVSDLPPENIHVLRQTEDGNIIAHHPIVCLGRDVNQILELVMGVPDRPDWSNNGLQKLFRMIEDGDLEGAKQVKAELEQSLGLDEPELAKADVILRRKEILGR
jgi:predicted ATP-binding protein involved in virulence